MDPVRESSAPRYSCFLDDDGRRAPGRSDLWVDAGVEVQLGSAPSSRLVHEAPHRSRFLTGYPLVWIRDPVRRLHAPYWAPRRWGPSLLALRPGERAPELPADLVAALQAVGAVADTPVATPEPTIAHELAVAAAGFRRDSYAKVAGLLPQAHVVALARYHQALLRADRVPLGDAQCEGRYGLHNESTARFFLHQLAGLVSSVVGEPVKPSYSYSVSYQPRATLGRHTDREQCEYTVSLLIAATGAEDAEPWPLWLEADGEPRAVRQQQGDALIFAGRRVPHWRSRLPAGRTSTSLLLHYVPAGFTASLS